MDQCVSDSGPKSLLTGHHGIVKRRTDEESLIVVYSLFLPLLAAFVFMLVVALFVRRTRRTTSGIPSQNNNSEQFHHKNNQGMMKFSSTSDLSLSQNQQLPRSRTTYSLESECRSGISSRSLRSSSSSLSAVSIKYYHRHRGGYSQDNYERSSQVDESDSSSAVDIQNQKRSKNLEKFVNIINIPKRIKAHNAEKNRFNVYAVPIETREQLKQIYVY